MFTDIKVGFTCNNRCVHCVVEPTRRDLERSARRGDLTTEEALAFIDEAWRTGSGSVVLTGGEITLRSDFPRLLSHARNLGLEVAVQTNGRLLEDWELTGAFQGVRAAFIVAVHGPDALVHDSVTRRPGSFDETMRGLDALRRHPEIAVTGKLVVSRLNRGHLLPTIEMLCTRGIDQFNVAFPHAERFPEEDLLAVVPRYREVAEEISRCAELFDVRGLRGEFETVPYCVVPQCPEMWKRSSDALLVARSVENPGFIRAAGDERLHDWEQERKAIKYKDPRCALCLFEKACEGPWREYVDAYGSDEFEPFRDPAVMRQLD